MKQWTGLGIMSCERLPVKHARWTCQVKLLGDTCYDTWLVVWPEMQSMALRLIWWWKNHKISKNADWFSGQLPANALLVVWLEMQSLALWLDQWWKTQQQQGHPKRKPGFHRSLRQRERVREKVKAGVNRQLPGDGWTVSKVGSSSNKRRPWP